MELTTFICNAVDGDGIAAVTMHWGKSGDSADENDKDGNDECPHGM